MLKDREKQQEIDHVNLDKVIRRLKILENILISKGILLRIPPQYKLDEDINDGR